MVEVKQVPVNFQKKLRAALAKGLASAGIRATIKMQKIPHTKLTRVLVLSSTFKMLRPSERQDLVWRIVSQNFTPDEQLLISMIMTRAPTEFVPA